jgi:hypothetical protein
MFAGKIMNFSAGSSHSFGTQMLEAKYAGIKMVVCLRTFILMCFMASWLRLLFSMFANQWCWP